MDTREHILEVALRVYAETGTRGATTRRIASEAGCNEVTLFRHFGTKENLLREALHQALDRLPPVGLPPEPRNPAGELLAWARHQMAFLFRYRALIRSSLAEFEEYPVMCAFVSESTRLVANELSAYLSRLRDRGLIDRVVDERSACAMLMGSLFSDAVNRDVMPERYPYSIEEAAERYVFLFLRAVGGRVSPPTESR